VDVHRAIIGPQEKEKTSQLLYYPWLIASLAPTLALMKVTGLDSKLSMCSLDLRELYESYRLDMNDTAVILQRPFHQKELCPADELLVLLVWVRAHDDVRYTRLILHGQEDKSLDSSWPLPRDHATCRRTYVLLRRL
jgi:hypothetical protein